MAIFAAVVAAALTAAAIFSTMEVVSARDKAAFVDRQYRNTENVFRAAIDPRFQSKADEVNRVLDRLVVIDAIEGGALFDESGHLQQTFGEVPDTSFETIRHARAMSFVVRDPRRIEFYYPPEVTGTPFHMLARVDAGMATALEAAGADRRTMFTAAAAGAAALATYIITFLLVSRPVRRINAVLDGVVANPASANQGAGPGRAVGEIGQLAATIERFRETLADVWRTKVAVADAILESAPFAVVQLTPDGSPAFANPAATALFEREITRGQDTEPLSIRDVATGTKAALRDHLLRHRGACRMVEIATTNGARIAVAGSLTVGADTRAPITIVMFSDVTEVHAARIDAETRFATGAALLRSARRRELELKLTLEACITLMSGPDRGEDAHLDIVPFAVEWLAAAKEVGIAGQTGVLSAEGPTVAGPAEDLKALVRLAFLVCYARCGQAAADISIDAKGINFDTAGVTVKVVRTGEPGADFEPAVADWQLAFAALRTAVRRVNGQLADFSADDGSATVRLVLRGAAERMSTMKAN